MAKQPPFREFQRSLYRTGRPVTVVVIAAIAACYVLAWFTKSEFFRAELAFQTLSKPWTSLTYPFASFGDGSDFIGTIFELYWLYIIGGEVENSVGGARYSIFLLAATLLGGLGVAIGSGLAGASHFGLEGPLLPIGAVTAAWASRNPKATVRLWAVIPITAMWLAWIYAGIILFELGNRAPIIGVFALLPLGAAWLFATNRIPGVYYSSALADKNSAKARCKEQVFRAEVDRRKIDRDERERLRKLFEGSISDEHKDK